MKYKCELQSEYSDNKPQRSDFHRSDAHRLRRTALTGLARMQLESVEDLIEALRGSGLFSSEQAEELISELTRLNTDAMGMMRHLIATERLTRYQLRKVAHGKAEELLIGPYIISDKLGEGGMGKVYRARYAVGGKQEIALKVVRAALVANPVVRGRYAREVQTAGTLAHPNIVRLYDAGEADGRFYLAMEFVDGIDLARMMQDFGRFEIAEACEYARQAALGLQHAHEKGFVHRDIKPSNIVVAGERHLPQASEPAIVKVLDLGLARAIDPDDMVVPNLTRDHTVVGTPDYMAPEQAKHSKRVDTRSDLYSLGCAIYFMLTGRVPFPKGGPIEKIIAHQTQIPTPIQSLRADMPAELVALIDRLMAREPEERIQTAGELAELLTPFTRYAEGALPVEVTVRDTASHEVTPASSILASQLPSPSTMPAPLRLEDTKDDDPPRPTAPSDPTPRPMEDAPKPDSSVRKKKKSQLRSGKNRRKAEAKKEEVHIPQIAWILLALVGVAMIALMLWLFG